uniref:Nuclease putative n=1 Tax=Albugo laibachii Nc14 TaxID=890382 RepID=F0WDW0_9STRA|nr:nuclease putative [Albugo laibachii Nc14]|eukprot:CCA19388.1 nuclease putative [Albugo laibachii Nc14]
MASGSATVKAVTSGDSLVLVGSTKAGPPPELTLTLSSLQAPKLARGSDQTNEPYAYSSREFLRKLCIGKTVRFKVEYRVNVINRDFGSIWLQNAEGEEHVNTLVAQEGYAKVKQEGNEGSLTYDLGKLRQLEALAIAEKRGIYQDPNDTKEAEFGPHVAVKWTMNLAVEDAEAIRDENKDKLIPALVENVRDGAFMRVLLIPSMQMINFGLAGVQCPRMNTAVLSSLNHETPENALKEKGVDGNTVTQAAPFAREAKHFTEMRLLHRNVDVKLQGVDKFGNFYGSVVHPSGKNISMELLRNGFARMVDWSSQYTSITVRTAMRSAEKEAKLGKLRVWRDYQPPALQCDQYLNGIVIEVVSGDCIVVCLDDKMVEKRIYLSSIRAPRLGNAKRQESNAPYALESKEFVRHFCIGKNVKVEVEYEKKNPVLNDSALMTYASVFLVDSKKKIVVNTTSNLVNVAAEVVSAGLAEVVRHRPEDEKSAYYDDLVAAEGSAQTKKKGIYSGKEVPVGQRYTDLCFDSVKAKQYLPFLSREKTLRAVVEYVYSGTRVKLFVPKENCMVNFVVAGIKCPQPTRYGGQGVVAAQAEAFGEQAKLFAKRNILQRNVTVEIEDMDRGGNAFGPLYTDIKKTERSHFGCMLLAEGLAWVDAFSVERTGTSAQLKRAEESAQQSKKNYWSSHDAKVSEKLAQMQVTKTADDTLPRVKISEIVNGTHFFIQDLSSRTCATIEEKLREFTRLNGVSGKTFQIRKNSICAALFTDESGQVWNRGKIESSLPDAKVRVRFIDYGNVAVLPVNCLRPLDATLMHFPPQAKECVFDFVKSMPVTEEFGHEAATMLADTAWGHTMSASVHGRDEQGRLQVSLFKNGKSVSGVLLQAGVIRIDRKAVRVAASYQQAIVDDLIAAQALAKKSRQCLWRYGDVESDDEGH